MGLRIGRVEDAPFIATLHKREIQPSLLADLGDTFLVSLYEGIISNDSSLCFVWEEKGAVKGFVTGVTQKNGLLTKTLRRRPTLVFRIIVGFLKDPRKIIPLLESVHHMCAAEGSELLSIVVDGNLQGKGVGQKLVASLENALRSMGVGNLYVLVDSQLPANKFYKRYGFIKTSSRPIGKRVMNLYEKEI